MIAALLGRLGGVSALFSGAMGALGLAPYGIWPLTLLSLALICVLFLETDTRRRAFRLGWLFGTGYFALALVWIVEPFFVQPEIHGWMAPFALIFMAAGLALFWAAAFWAAHGAGRMRGLALIGAWALSEVARAYMFTGFPWAGVAQIWVGAGPDQLLALIGPHGLGLATLAVGGALGRVLRPDVAWRIRAIVAGIVGVAIAAPIAWSTTLVAPPSAQDKSIRLVQPNAPQDQKWDPAMIPVFLDRKLGFSAAGPRPDLIIWPETSIPVLMEYADPILADISEASQDVPVIAGIQRRQGARLYNAALLIEDGIATQVYDKHHLVPFGEYIPFGDLAARFGLRGFAAREGAGFSAGPGTGLFDLGPLGKALPLICYEAVFPQLAWSEARPGLLIQITNDAWFGAHSGPYQHLAQARMRAIEQGLPMIRVANTGVSAVIDARGHVVAQIPLGEADYLDADLPGALPRSIYARVGDWPATVMAVLLILVAFAFALSRRAGNSN